MVVILSGGPRLFRFADGRIVNTDGWKGMIVHKTAKDIRKAIAGMETEDAIATFSPLYVIEAQINIYNEFSTGPFLFRVGHYLSKKNLVKYIGTSKVQINDFLNKHMPKAILVGHDPLIEQPLIDYAKARNYSKIDKDFDGLTLYIQNE